MNGDTAMPTIAFGEGTTYDSLYALLWLANQGLGEEPGLMFRFELADGSSVTGWFVGDDDDVVARTKVRLYGRDGIVTVPTDDIVRIVYL